MSITPEAAPSPAPPQAPSAPEVRIQPGATVLEMPRLNQERSELDRREADAKFLSTLEAFRTAASDHAVVRHNEQALEDDLVTRVRGRAAPTLSGGANRGGHPDADILAAHKDYHARTTHDRMEKATEIGAALEEQIATGDTGRYLRMLGHATTVARDRSRTAQGAFARSVHRRAEADLAVVESRRDEREYQAWYANNRVDVPDEDSGPRREQYRTQLEYELDLQAFERARERALTERKARDAVQAHHSLASADARLSRAQAEEPFELAVRRAVSQGGAAEALTMVVGRAGERYEQHRQRLDRLNQAATVRLDAWQLGQEVPDPQLAAEIEQILNAWGQELNSVPPYGRDRAMAIDDWTLAAIRYGQRQALADVPDGAEFTASREIVIQTPDGPRALYDDGSIGAIENGQEVRRMSDGSIAPDREAPDIIEPTFYRDRERHSDEDVERLFRNSLVTWDRSRTEEMEVFTAFAARLHGERTAEHAAAMQQTLDERVAALEGIEQSIVNTERNLETYQNGRAHGGNTAGTSGDTQRQVAQEARQRLLALQTERENTKQQIEADRHNLATARVRANQADYWRSFFAITQREAAGAAPNDRIGMARQGGAILATDHELNNQRGIWFINPSGVGILRRPGRADQVFLANGRPH